MCAFANWQSYKTCFTQHFLVSEEQRCTQLHDQYINTYAPQADSIKSWSYDSLFMVATNFKASFKLSAKQFVCVHVHQRQSPLVHIYSPIRDI